MLVEIPDPPVIAGVIIAFFVGIFGIMVYNKIRSFVGQKDTDPSYLSRLEYYERQLIDMKIRLDALDLEEKTPPFEPIQEKIAPVLEKKENPITNKVDSDLKEADKVVPKQRIPNMDFEGIAERVLGLITTKEMTSRDIQVTIGRSREHTSRLMKRLFEEGFVERNTKNRPYTYRITDKGKAKVGNLERALTV